LVVDRQPTAVTRNLAVTCPPSSVRTTQRPVASSYSAATIRVLNWMSLRRSYRSATCRRYLRISGWGAKRSLQVHSCSRSSDSRSEKL
jgi:hypothetical protein